MIDRLEEKGLVTRKRNDSDRRQVNVMLTEKGRSIQQQAPTALQTRFLENFSKLQEWEQMAILSSLQRVGVLLEAKDLEAWPVLDVGNID
jgi:DNA-binding MarR family transcriptional regulator